MPSTDFSRGALVGGLLLAAAACAPKDDQEPPPAPEAGYVVLQP